MPKRIKEINDEISRCQLQLSALESAGETDVLCKFLGAGLSAHSIEYVRIDTLQYEITLHGRNIRVVCDEAFTTTEDKLSKIFSMKGFVDWCNSIDKAFFDESNYQFTKIIVQSIDLFGPRVGFLKLCTDLKRKDPRKGWVIVPSIMLIRGGAVAILVVLHSEETGQLFCPITIQTRFPAGKQSFKEIFAGMLDDSGNLLSVAGKELKEEAGISTGEGELIDMIGAAGLKYEGIPGLYPSVGGCDEYLGYFLHRTVMPLAKIKELDGKMTGVLEEGEEIKLKLVEMKDLAKECPDMKTFTALYLYSRIPDLVKLPPEFVQEIKLNPAQLTLVRNLASVIQRKKFDIRVNEAYVRTYVQQVNNIKNFTTSLKLSRLLKGVDGLSTEEFQNLRDWAKDQP